VEADVAERPEIAFGGDGVGIATEAAAEALQVVAERGHADLAETVFFGYAVYFYDGFAHGLGAKGWRHGRD
jgi:hypothetical protein